MKTDAQLRADVMDELEWDPSVNAAHIGVMVNDGVVTLAGHLESHMEKRAAERAVRHVAGVRGIALDLEVKLSPRHARGDHEIAEAAVAALALNSLVPEGKVQVEVENGWVTLRGEVEWAYQYASAEQSVAPLAGVRGIVNHIVIRPAANATNVASRISAALRRRADREARHLAVELDGSVATLRGKVHSLAERDAALGAARSTSGVSRVIDHLEIEP
jgi:osmotically-inducible protein OsmY